MTPARLAVRVRIVGLEHAGFDYLAKLRTFVIE